MSLFSSNEMASWRTTNVFPVRVSVSYITKCHSFHISLPIQLWSLWNFKLKLLGSQLTFPTCLSVISWIFCYIQCMWNKLLNFENCLRAELPIRSWIWELYEKSHQKRHLIHILHCLLEFCSPNSLKIGSPFRILLFIQFSI